MLLIEVDYSSSKKALIASQKYSPYELGFAKMVHLNKESFIGKAALEKDQKEAVSARQFVGLEIDWTEVEERYEKFGLTPAAPSQASHIAGSLPAKSNVQAKPLASMVTSAGKKNHYAAPA